MPSSTAAMLALLFDGPAPDTGTSRVASIPAPEAGAGEVAIDVHYAGVNFIDVMARRGDAGYAASWPCVPGLEVAGTVRAIGTGVDSVDVGDRVSAFTGGGGLAEVAVARDELVVGVPDGLDLALAAVAPGALTTAELLLTDAARLQPGETALVHSAAGGVGQAVAQVARRAGAGRLIGTVGRADGVAAAERAGYDAVLVRGPDLAAAIRERVGDRGIEVILDPQGTALLDVDLEVPAPGARIVLFGNATGQPLGPLPPAGRLLAGNVSIGGYSLSRLAATAPGRVARALGRMLDGLAAAELDIHLFAVDGVGLDHMEVGSSGPRCRRGRFPHDGRGVC